MGDEIDSIAKKRDSSSHSKVYDRSVQQLLSCLDGAVPLNNCLIIGTTNRFQDIDSALLRPGRFGVHVFVALPDEHQRYELLTKSKINAMERVIQELFDGDKNEEQEQHLYEDIQSKFSINHRDIVCALDEIRINQVYRERNGRQTSDNYAYDVMF